MPSHRVASDDLFCIPTFHFSYGRISECLDQVKALADQGHRVHTGIAARFLIDLIIRLRSGVDAPDLGNRWADHIESITGALRDLIRLRDPDQMTDFLASAYGKGLVTLHEWDHQRGGGIALPKNIVPVVIDGKVVGLAKNFGPGEGRPIRRKPDSAKAVIGELNPPLDQSEVEMLALFFKLFPSYRRAHPRGQPKARHWRLEGPSKHVAVDGTVVLSHGALLLFFKRYCEALKAYEDSKLAKGRKGEEWRQREREELLRVLASIVGNATADVWLSKVQRPAPRRARGTAEKDFERQWLFCRMTAEVTGASTQTVHQRLTAHVATWNRLVSAHPKAVTAYPPAPTDNPLRSIHLHPRH